jgi:threonyl-tRNA synthetase
MADLHKIRHSLSHILAQAIQRFYDPNVKLGIGPAIDNGFYYDFLFSQEPISDKELKKIEKHMKNILKENQKFKKIILPYPLAKQLLELMNQPFKLELLEEINKNNEEISFYANIIPFDKKEKITKNSLDEYIQLYDKINDFLDKTANKESDEFVTFIDLCEGPHVEETSQIPEDSFKLYKVAGAYWRGDEHNPMLTRIYGLAFENKEKLEEYLKFLEEAKKRDHRILGPKLGLFTIKPEEVGPGLILWKPKGATLYNILAHYM